jgi:NADH-quinone oxidoreductase subunit M
MVGALYERSHSRQIGDNLGLGRRLPAYMFFFGLFTLASFGFPGTNGFVSEALVLIGVFSVNTWAGALVIPGVLLAAAYMLRLFLKLAWGAPSSVSGWKDLNSREYIYLIPLALLVIYLGLAPGLALRVINPSIVQLLTPFEVQFVVKQSLEEPNPSAQKPEHRLRSTGSLAEEPQILEKNASPENPYSFSMGKNQLTLAEAAQGERP